MSEKNTGRAGAGVSVSPEDLAAIEAETRRSRVGYRVEVGECSEGRPMVHVVAGVEALTVHLLPNNAGDGWGALTYEGAELATGPTIRAIVADHGARLFA